MPGKAPVDRVGGTQSDGPWPDHVDEIVEGEQYEREVVLEDGTRATRTVTITRVQQIRRDDGTPTDGYVVSFTHDGGGGA